MKTRNKLMKLNNNKHIQIKLETLLFLKKFKKNIKSLNSINRKLYKINHLKS